MAKFSQGGHIAPHTADGKYMFMVPLYPEKMMKNILSPILLSLWLNFACKTKSEKWRDDPKDLKESSKGCQYPLSRAYRRTPYCSPMCFTGTFKHIVLSHIRSHTDWSMFKIEEHAIFCSHCAYWETMHSLYSSLSGRSNWTITGWPYGVLIFREKFKLTDVICGPIVRIGTVHLNIRKYEKVLEEYVATLKNILCNKMKDKVENLDKTGAV